MEPSFLSLAKIAKPHMQDAIPRKRLFSLLDESRSHPAVWVSGPAGSGKTTLISSYIDTCKLPCLWYRIDQRDSDIATFFYYMWLAGKEISPSRKRPLPLLTPEYIQGLSVFTKRFFEDLFDRLQKPCVLVLDDYQDAKPEGGALDEVLRNVLSVIPKGINVCILSRGAPPPLLAKASASQTLQVIGWRELRLRPRESRDLVRARCKTACSEALTEFLYRKTDGWVAGLLCLLKRAEIAELDDEVFDRFPTHELFDYFAGEIFEQAEPEIQEFLLKTSVFPEVLTAGMAESLTGFGRAGALFSFLTRNHWFTERHTGKAFSYRYHPMFREFLQSRAAGRYPASEMTRLKARAARLLEERGQIEAAVDLVLECGDTIHASRLILTQAQTLMLQGRTQTLEQWLNHFSAELLDQEAWLIYWLGICRMSVDPAEARRHFENALDKHEQQQDTAGIFSSLCGVLDSITFGSGTFRLLDPWIVRLEALSSRFDALPSRETKGRVTSSMLLALTLRRPKHDEFKIWEERSRALIRKDIPTEIKIRMLLPLILHRAFLGRLQEAEHLIEIYRKLAEAQDITPLGLITLKELEAFHYWASGDFQACRIAVKSALELADTTGVTILSSYVLVHGTSGALSSGDIDEASDLLRRLGSSVDLNPGWAREGLHVLLLWKGLLEGDLPKAVFHGEEALKQAEETGTLLSSAVNDLGMSLALHSSGRTDEANELLERAFRTCRDIGSRQIEFGCSLARAEFTLDTGDRDGGLDALESAMSIGRTHRYWNTWFWRSDRMAALCREALRAGIEITYVQELIRRRRLAPEDPPLEIDLWPWILKIFALGGFGVIKDGNPLSFSKKVQERPLSLLKVLVSLGGVEVNEHRIADRLWPDADGDAAHGAFKTTLHRLRKLLGYHEAIHLSAGWVSLNQRYCWLDTWAFEQAVANADAAWRSAGEERKDKAVELTRRALDLYSGPLLPSEDQWGFSLRRRLHSRFLRLIETLAGHWQICGRWEDAMEVYRRGLEADDTAEACYRGLMICNLQLGWQAEVRAVYEQCREALAAASGATPSPDLERLSRDLPLGGRT